MTDKHRVKILHAGSLDKYGQSSGTYFNYSRMKRKQFLIGNIVGAVLVLTVIIVERISLGFIINNLLNSKTENSSIGIIGGADGPTALFVSGNFDFHTAALMIRVSLFLVLILLILDVFYFIRHR